MEKSLTGLFGSGPDADAKTARARDFVKRFSEGPPDQGYTSDEAVGQLNDLLGYANSDQVERATRNALQNLPENQRAEFGQFVNQLQARKSGGRPTASSGSPSIDDISRMFGQAGGPATSVNDLFGSLFGGMSGGSGGSTGGGVGGMLSNLLGGLLGGGKSRATQSTGASGAPDLGGLLGSNVGKMVMGGIAAYLTKELLDGSR